MTLVRAKELKWGRAPAAEDRSSWWARAAHHRMSVTVPTHRKLGSFVRMGWRDAFLQQQAQQKQTSSGGSRGRDQRMNATWCALWEQKRFCQAPLELHVRRMRFLEEWVWRQHPRGRCTAPPGCSR